MYGPFHMAGFYGQVSMLCIFEVHNAGSHILLAAHHGRAATVLYNGESISNLVRGDNAN